MRRFALLGLLVTLLLSLPTTGFAAPRVTMSAKAANEGRVKSGHWATVIVDLSNEGPELSGELVVRNDFGGDSPGPHQYIVQVALAAGAKKRVPVQIPFEGNGRFFVQFMSGGGTAAEANVPLTILPVNAFLIGVLTDDDQGIPALAQVNIGGTGNKAEVVRLDAGSFPNRSLLLDSFDAVVISRFDSSRLSDDQRRALEAWVAHGGTLLVTGGPEWRRTIAPLPASLIPVSVSASAETDISALGTFADQALTARTVVSVGRATRGKVLVSNGEIPLAVSDQIGAGRVVYLAVDPGLDPVTGWTGQSKLLNRLLNGKPPQGFDQGGWADQQITQALRQMPGLSIPALGLISLLLLAYLVIVGPVNYAVLKRVDRREWMWFTIPAFSAIAVALIYAVGFGRRTPLTSNQITVTEVTAGGGVARSTLYVGLFAPSMRSLSISLPESRLVRPLTLQFGGNGATNARVVSSDRRTLQLSNLSNFEVTGFLASQDVPLKGGLELTELVVTNGTLQGKVINRLTQPLSDVNVYTGTGYTAVGTIAAGATSTPFTVAFVATNDPVMSKRGMGMVRSAPMPGYSHGSGETLTEDVMRRMPVLDGMVQQLHNRGTFPQNIMVSGWTKEPIVPIDLSDLGRSDAGANLVYTITPLPIDATTGDLPPGFVTGRVVQGAGTANPSQAGFDLMPGEYTFQFDLPAGVVTNISEMTLHLGVADPNMTNASAVRSITLQAKDQKTGKWVDLKAAISVPLPEWRSLVTAQGLFEIKLTASSFVHMSQPTVSTKGVAR